MSLEEFNGWDETANEMERVEPESIGVFETFVPNIGMGVLYKYLIETADGTLLYKAILMQTRQSFVREPPQK